MPETSPANHIIAPAHRVTNNVFSHESTPHA
jgi:hypothetical protein